MPDISVIIPVFNAEKYLNNCLNSVCNQSLQDIEIICVNDGSTDDSDGILRDFANRDNRIRIIDLEENRGVSIARNIGIQASKGTYLGFVDSDDLVEKDFFENLFYESQNGADIIKGEIRRISTFSEINGAVVEYLDDSISLSDRYLTIGNTKNCFANYFFSAIYRRSLIVDNGIWFPENLKYAEDICFALSASALANRIDTVIEAVYLYNYNDVSAINTILKNSFYYLYSIINATDIIIDMLHSYDLEKNVYIDLVCIYLMVIHYASGILKSHYNEMNIEEQWIEYILGKCEYRDMICDKFNYEVNEAKKKMKKHQLDLARKMILQKNK